MLDYVYNGEVNIEQDQLDRFLTIAQRFQLEGLISDESGELEDEEDTPSTVMNNSNIIHPESENVEDVKKINRIGVKEHIKISSEEFRTVEELDEKIKENLSRGVSGKWQCNICNKESRDISHAKEHVEAHFEGLSFPCQNCERTFRSRCAFRKHKAQRCTVVISGPGAY